jgi:glycosyltransferase involved in cell wall biosynthesis
MKNNDLLSIIVPNYNNEKYLVECLDSILYQTYRPIEIIIIDDASTDGSKMILKKYAAQHAFINVIYNTMNQGVTKARDQAINLAKAVYITTLDSDDYYLDNHKLEQEINIIKQYQQQGKENIIAFSNIILVDEIGKKLNHQMKKIAEGDVFIQFFARSCMIPRDFIFTKKQYDAVGGFDFIIPLYEDWDLKLRLAYQNKFYYSGVDGIAYRRHGNGLSAVSDAQHIQWLTFIYEKNRALVASDQKRYIKKEVIQCIKKDFGFSFSRWLKQKIKKILS